MAITTVITDFSRVLLYFKDTDYTGTLNGKHKELKEKIENYNILDHFNLDTDLLAYYAALKERGMTLAIFTSDSIQDDPGLAPFLSPIFNKEHIFSAKRLGVKKSQAEGYSVLLSKLGKEPEEVLYIDDSEKNISAASKAGLHVVTFIDTPQAKKAIAGFLDFE